MEKLSNIGVKIAQLRRSRGMTQEELGKRLSVSAQAVSKWENGDSLPDLSIVVELAKTFECTTDYFPLNLLPDEILPVLLALLREMDDLKPDYAVDEKTLQSLLPNIMNFDHVLTECIELGFVDRVRGGYRLNFKADLAVRLLAIIHQTINKQGTMNVMVGK